MAAIAYWCATRHVPAVQQQIQVNAEAAVSSVVASDVTTTVYGRTVTLKGSVANENQKSELLSALSTADGVRHINDDELTVVGSEAAEAPSNDSPEQPSMSVLPSDTPASNGQTPQNNSPVQETSGESPSANVDSSNTPNSDSPSGNVASAGTPPTDSPGPESPSPEGPSPVAQSAEMTPPAPPSPEPTTPEVTSAEVLSPESPTPEVASAGPPSPAGALSPATPTQAPLSAEAPSPVSPTNNTPGGPAASPDKNAQPPTVELAELGVANEPTTGSSSDAPSPADTSPALIEVLEGEGESSTFSMQIKDDTLTLTGDISSEDDSLSFIQSAMRTFDVNYLVNSMQVNEENSNASWLPALTEFIPSMQPVADAGITIFESQITLSGTAPDTQTHDKIVDDALSLLSELSLVDSIIVSSGGPAPAAASEPQAAATTETAGTSPQASSSSQQITQNNAQPNAERTSTTAEQLSTLREAFKALEAEKILFQSGSDVLTEESIQTVAAMSALLAKYTDINIEIDGHTDSAGTSENNLQLSQLRANAVRDLMIERGIARERLSAYGFGDGVPIADNSTAEGRKLNRRIEFNF